jgi:hypothetical protein
MASPAAQAKAQALNAKLEGEARVAIDDIEKHCLRKEARKSYVCSVKCYDKAGSTQPIDVLEQCVRQCQAPHQQANGYVQQEIGQFQNRLHRAMNECQDKARDMMQPGYENDAKKMDKVEGTLISCISKTVDEYIGMLKPMKDRVAAQINK